MDERFRGTRDESGFCDARADDPLQTAYVSLGEQAGTIRSRTPDIRVYRRRAKPTKTQHSRRVPRELACFKAAQDGDDSVISIGCDLKGLLTPCGTLMNGDDVPALREDFARGDEKIWGRVIQLVDESRP